MLSFRAFAPLALVAAITPFFDGGLAPALAQDGYHAMSCGDLWYRRNEIFASNGYCFKTERGQRVFGNQGCRFYVESDVKMSRAEREEVEIIRSVERRKGCEG